MPHKFHLYLIFQTFPTDKLPNGLYWYPNTDVSAEGYFEIDPNTTYDRFIVTPLPFSSFATAAGEPNNGVIYNCPLMTSYIDTVEPPTEFSMQMCSKPAINICVKPIPGKYTVKQAWFWSKLVAKQFKLGSRNLRQCFFETPPPPLIEWTNG